MLRYVLYTRCSSARVNYVLKKGLFFLLKKRKTKPLVRVTGGPDLLTEEYLFMCNSVLFLYFENWPSKAAGPNNRWPIVRNSL